MGNRVVTMEAEAKREAGTSHKMLTNFLREVCSIKSESL